MKLREADYNQATDDDEFWLKAAEPSLDRIWGNSDDDIYAELLERWRFIPKQP
jgi:hypothetical protein